MTGLWVALAAIVLALLVGGYRALTDGRFRGTHHVRGARSDARAASDPSAGRGASAVERIETTRTPEPAEPAEPEPTTWTHLAGAANGTAAGERATLVQFSSAFCAPCRVTRRVLADVAGSTEGVTHLEIDAEHHLDVVRRLGILRTPTTLVLDADGREVARAAGAPRREQVLAALPLP